MSKQYKSNQGKLDEYKLIMNEKQLTFIRDALKNASNDVQFVARKDRKNNTNTFCVTATEELRLSFVDALKNVQKTGDDDVDFLHDMLVDVPKLQAEDPKSWHGLCY